MQGISFFTYAGVSSRAYNLYITGDHVHSGPERDIETVPIPGRDGDLAIDNGRYKNMNLPLQCFYRATAGDVEVYARKIKGWLMAYPAQYLPLEFSYNPDYYRLATFTGPIDIDTSIRQYGQTQVGFNCKPFQHAKSGLTMRDITTARQLVNPEAFASLPYIRITGSGNIRFTAGSTSWDFAGVDGYIEIDSEMMNTYRGTLPQNASKTGDGYPALSPGLNNFAWTGSVSKVEIIPRWRTL